jgi:hypothetical protein
MINDCRTALWDNPKLRQGRHGLMMFVLIAIANCMSKCMHACSSTRKDHSLTPKNENVFNSGGGEKKVEMD